MLFLFAYITCSFMTTYIKGGIYGTISFFSFNGDGDIFMENTHPIRSGRTRRPEQEIIYERRK